VEFHCARTHIPGRAVLDDWQVRVRDASSSASPNTHIQNLYQEWNDIKAASEVGQFVLFCIDQPYRRQACGKIAGKLRPGLLHQPPGRSGLSGGTGDTEGLRFWPSLRGPDAILKEKRWCCAVAFLGNRAKPIRGKFYLFAVIASPGVPG